jgi:hypothetical protein
MKQLTTENKLDILFKVLNTAYSLNQTLEDQGTDWQIEMSKVDYNVLIMFISIYSIFKGSPIQAKTLSTEIELMNYFNIYYNMKFNGRRDDELVEVNTASTIMYLYMIFNHTSFTIENQFLFDCYQFIEAQKYLYNTENEDGNKIEYEDLTTVEKQYTDKIMDQINQLYEVKKTLEKSTNYQKIGNIKILEKIDTNELINYIQDTTNILFKSYKNVIGVSIEHMFEILKTYTVLYVDEFINLDKDYLKSSNYKTDFVNFMGEDLYDEYILAISDSSKYFNI